MRLIIIPQISAEKNALIFARWNDFIVGLCSWIDNYLRHIHRYLYEYYDGGGLMRLSKKRILRVKIEIVIGQALQTVVGGVNRLKLGLDQRSEDVDFADIVNQSEQYPLYIHFPFGA